MKQTLALLCTFLISLSILGQDNPYLNLDFEEYTPMGHPKSWMMRTGIGKMMVSHEEPQSGDVCLETSLEKDDYIMVSNSLPDEALVNKTFRITGKIKTMNITKYATFFLRADNHEGESIVFENMAGKWAKGDTDWQTYSLELKVPENTARMVFGILVVGQGKAFYDDLSISIDNEPFTQVRPKPLIPTAGDLAWIKKNASPFEDLSEARAFKDMVGTHRLVLLGAGSNGTVEFDDIRLGITRYLLEEKDFSVVAVEADALPVAKVNHYVKTGEGDLKSLLSQLDSIALNTREFMSTVMMMRSLHQSGKSSPSLVGIHVKSPELAIESVKTFVARVDPQFFDKLNRYYYHNVSEIWKTFNGPSGRMLADNDTWRNEATLVLKHLQDNAGSYAQNAKKSEIEQAIFEARLVVQNVDYHSKGMLDAALVENIQWILEKRGVNTGVVVWSHNDRVRKDGKAMGALLAQKYGDAVLNMGFLFHEGTYTAQGEKGIASYETYPSEPGCAEWFLKESGLNSFLLDLRKASGNSDASWLTKSLEIRSIHDEADAYAFKKDRLGEMFDTVTFFQKSNPTHPLPVTKTE